jgi:nucleoside-diphosphate-sugar epimerase
MIVVTGAAGVIGRALMVRLHADRLPYTALDREALARGGPASLISAVPRRPSALVHLAAAVPRPPSIPDDDFSASRTREMDERVLEAARQWGCHVVYASGCSLYAKGGAAPKREEQAGTAVAQTSPYLVAKQKGEHDFLASESATVLRISAPIGEGLPPATVAGRFLETAKAGGILDVWGSGNREQNYVDVVDIADALIRTLIVRPSGLINIAADRPITMLDLAQEVVRACGRGGVRMTGKPDPRDGEPARYSNQRAADVLGWRPMTSMGVSLERLCRINL